MLDVDHPLVALFMFWLSWWLNFDNAALLIQSLLTVVLRVALRRDPSMSEIKKWAHIFKISCPLEAWMQCHQMWDLYYTHYQCVFLKSCNAIKHLQCICNAFLHKEHLEQLNSIILFIALSIKFIHYHTTCLSLLLISYLEGRIISGWLLMRVVCSSDYPGSGHVFFFRAAFCWPR